MQFMVKIGRSASEEIILSLVNSKCIPCLLYGLDTCPINRAAGNSLDFTVRRLLEELCLKYFTPRLNQLYLIVRITLISQTQMSPNNRGNASFSQNLQHLKIVYVILSIHLRNVS